MKLFIRLYLFVCFLLASLFLSAQDSLLVSWKTESVNIKGNCVSVRFSGKISKGWHVYSYADDTEGLSGIMVGFIDSVLSSKLPEILTPSVSINDPIFENKSLRVSKDSLVFLQEAQFEKIPDAFQVRLNYEAGAGENFIPEEQILTVRLGSAETGQKTAARLLIPSINPDSTATQCTTSGEVASDAQTSGLFQIFLLGFLGGLVALLTPCVFPMIPLTVSFFTKKAGTRKQGITNASVYGLFIFLIYFLLSLPFHFLDSLNPEILNNISTNVWLNVLFFVIFVFFAFSFFGYYEITLPASFSSKADSKAGTGNLAGIFFMALTLCLVSFSCTGPILGSLLAGSLTSNGGAMQLTSGMSGFGLALALPFALFALFPNWLNSLPRSGGWLNTVKVVLGFLELALAFKFLSNADLVKHWGILKREIFIGAWVIIGILLSAYLLGLLRFKKEDAPAQISWGRKLTALITILFTLYLLPGLTNTKYANLTLISGFPPPLYYSIYQQESECILGLNCTHDYEEGLAMARKENKPLLIDFTGYACVNCRRMEENIWSKPEVYSLMKDNFIVVSLYVDDKQLLPASERFTFITKDGMEKQIRTVGDKWAAFETENFRNNAQPWYAILDTDERLLTRPVGYTPSADEYLSWLQCGLDAFRK